TKTDLSIRKINQKAQAYLERELKRFEPYALSVYSGPPNGYTSIKPLYEAPRRRDGVVPVVHILPGGSLASPADEVTPGILSAMQRQLNTDNTDRTDLHGLTGANPSNPSNPSDPWSI